MNNISILDCTLRDGGYVNSWRFGKPVILSIVDKLEQSNVDIIECGFLRDVQYDENCSVFSNMEQLIPIISPKKPNIMYVGMIALGDIDAEKIAPWTGDAFDGIRLTFHKHEWEPVCELAQKLMAKGYKVFIQPVGTSSYTDMELLTLVEKVNRLRPFSFYIVDTLGAMYQNNLLHTFYLIDNNLDPDIVIGYHSHNNLQLAFSNSQALMTLHTKRQIILDASVFGMGRAAGNLCTELVTQYINANVKPKYDIVPLLQIIDDHLMPIYNETPWGYSIPYYLSAVDGTHPDYATHLLNKQRLTVRSISTILSGIPVERRSLFDKGLIEEHYLHFQANETDDLEAISKLREVLAPGRPVLLLAPGKTVQTCCDSIKDFIREKNPLIISINFVSDEFPYDILFVSNVKRFNENLPPSGSSPGKVVVTSNIRQAGDLGQALVVNYASLIGQGPESDNAGIMLMRLLLMLDVRKAYLAGFDGFSADAGSNFFSHDLVNNIGKSGIAEKNAAIHMQIQKLREHMQIEFITPSAYARDPE